MVSDSEQITPSCQPIVVKGREGNPYERKTTRNFQFSTNSYEDVCLPEVIFRLMDLPEKKDQVNQKKTAFSSFDIYSNGQKTTKFDGCSYGFCSNIILFWS